MFIPMRWVLRGLLLVVVLAAAPFIVSLIREALHYEKVLAVARSDDEMIATARSLGFIADPSAGDGAIEQQHLQHAYTVAQTSHLCGSLWKLTWQSEQGKVLTHKLSFDSKCF